MTRRPPRSTRTDTVCPTRRSSDLDVDIEWTAGLLSGEVRLDCEEGYQWLRSGRRIHIFGEVADEPGIMSVGSAGLLSPSTIVCRSEDAAAVHAADRKSTRLNSSH